MKLLASILFVSFSCLSLHAMAGEPIKNPQSPNTSMSKAASESLREGDVLEILMTINKNEINAAKLALEKSSNSKVKQFAQHMQMDHSKNLTETKAIAAEIKIQPVPSPLSNNLHDKGKKELAKLSDMSGKVFDLAYMKAMVKGHQGALEIIDSKLIPNAKSPKLETHLQMTKTTVEHHLEMAKNTLNSLTNQKH